MKFGRWKQLLVTWGALSVLAVPELPGQQVRVAAETGEAPTMTAAMREMMVRPVVIDFQHVSLRNAVAALATRAGVRIQYRADLLDATNKVVTIPYQELALEQALERILRGTAMRAVPLTENIITIKPDSTAQGQVDRMLQDKGTLVGKVLHAKTRQPVKGAKVYGCGPQPLTVSEDGTFRALVTEGETTLDVRAIGFAHQAKRVTVKAHDVVTVEILLEPSSNVLDEVIVTGTVTATERKAIVTPITVITAEEIERRGITRVTELMRGEIPGVVVLERGSRVYEPTVGGMAKARVFSRGASDQGDPGGDGVYDAAPNPLKTYVDGVEMVDPSFIATIDPNTIERIEVIAGPQAAAMYGSGAMGGVMQIFTKRGMGASRTDMTLNLKYGMMENNLSTSLAPLHNHTFRVNGGGGPVFSYAGTLSYLYSGQWQPFLFNRTLGASLGATHTKGAFTMSGTVTLNRGLNGTYRGDHRGQLGTVLRRTGEWRSLDDATRLQASQTRASYTAQTLALNMDYRIGPFWQHHVTVGRDYVGLAKEPISPRYSLPYDSLYDHEVANSTRTSMKYNTSVRFSPNSALTSTLAVEMTGSINTQISNAGCTPTESATELIPCYTGYSVRAGKSPNDNSWGGFGSWRIGILESAYIDMGIRGERNPNYGTSHRIDWAPTTGIAITKSYKDLTIKALASYGRATRPPTADMQKVITEVNPQYDPMSFVSQIANPDLGPEYSGGPQGGFELYYGNLGSFTVNRYKQYVTDLIKWVPVDSISRFYIPDQVEYYSVITQYRNAARVLQEGWEFTGSLNLGPLNLQGTLSQMQSRVNTTDPLLLNWYGYYDNASFQSIPSQTGNVNVRYAYRGTSVTLTANMIGKSLKTRWQSPDGIWLDVSGESRLQMYLLRRRNGPTVDAVVRNGYWKSNLAASQRVTSWASFTLNISNLGNSFGTDGRYFDPALGRQTTLGVSLKYPMTY